MINKAILTGRLTELPELKKTSSDVSVTSFSIAVQRRIKGANGEYPTDFINVVAWRGTAEFICNHFGKGELIGLVGSIQSRNYEDKNGNKRTAIEVVADEAHFIESKKAQNSSENGFLGQANNLPSQAQTFAPPSNLGGNQVEFEEVQDDELPF